MTDKSIKYAAMNIEVASIEDHDYDWAIMNGARALAKELELFDSAMYAATAGKLTHAQACEMPMGHFMVLDMSEDKRVRGFASPHSIGEGDGAVVPNHMHLVLLRRDTYILMAMCKGRNIPIAIPGIPLSFTADDPSYLS